MNKQRYDGHLNGSGDYAAPISCVICKTDMNHACLTQVLDMDLDDYGENLFPDSMSIEKKDKLLTIMGHPIPKYDSDSE